MTRPGSLRPPPPRHDLSVFLHAALRHPQIVGALVPSSSALAARLASIVPSTGEPTVVELGPGTGVVSEAIHRRLGTRGRHVAIEVDAGLVRHLSRTRPWLEVVHGDARALDTLLDNAGIVAVDAIVSGLPWALFTAEQQEAVLDPVRHLLRPDGAFTTFAYLHALPLSFARQFAGRLRAMFDEVLVTRIVWRNLPPAVSYVCRRPFHAPSPDRR